MKRILLSLLLLISLVTQAKDVKGIKDLHSNDKFSLRITIPMEISNNISYWDFKQAQKIDIDFQVVSVEGDSMRIAVKPVRWLIYYQRVNNNKSFVYFDSDYLYFHNAKSIFYMFEENPIIASVSTLDHSFDIKYTSHSKEEESFGISRKYWYLQALTIPNGLKTTSIDEDDVITDIQLNFDEMINKSLAYFIKEWDQCSRKNESIPWLLDMSEDKKQKSGIPAFIQTTSTSFGSLSANTKVIFRAPLNMPEDKIFIHLGNNKIKPAKHLKDNSYEFNFFMSMPKRAYLQDIILDLTPCDSVSITYNSNEGFRFDGRGAANSSYINSIVKLYDSSDNVEVSTDSEEFYKTTLEKYSNEMNGYWLKSAQLSYNYWVTSAQIKEYNDRAQTSKGAFLPTDEDTFWDNQYSKDLQPFVEYLYQPYPYGDFINSFFVYKGSQIRNNTITAMKYLQSQTPAYYFVDAVFWGYPKSYLAGNILEDMMKHFHLDRSNREYEDFLTKQQDPEIKELIVSLHQQLMNIEPGANLRGLNLDIEKYIPLKNKTDGYIILLVGDSLGFNDVTNRYIGDIEGTYENMLRGISEAELENKIQLCFITNEHNKPLLDIASETQKKIIFVPDEMIRDYEYKVVSRKRCFLIIRNDGVILDRTFDSSVYSKYPDSKFVLDVIQKDIEKRQNQDSASSGVLPIIIIILFSVSITFVIARYVILRREKLKRHIQELELKAIRAQINPHFTFNALGSIQNLISQKKDKEANEYLVNFAKLLRMVLSTSEKKLVPLSDEIQLLDLYLQLEQLRIPFKYAINIENDIDIENEEIPGMLIQPIVENAVKHGIAPKGRGYVTLNFKMKTESLLVEVIDSGDGFDDKAYQSTKGFGLKSIKERLSLLNKEFHLNIDFEIENIIENSDIIGAKVSLYIPI